MRSLDIQQNKLFSYVSLESRIPKAHPIRKLRLLVDTILKEMDGDFAGPYSEAGRPSIPPERLSANLSRLRQDHSTSKKWAGERRHE
jgi:hypothetical protein